MPTDKPPAVAKTKRRKKSRKVRAAWITAAATLIAALIAFAGALVGRSNTSVFFLPEPQATTVSTTLITTTTVTATPSSSDTGAGGQSPAPSSATAKQLAISTQGGESEWDFADGVQENGRTYDNSLWTCADLVNGNGLNCAHTASAISFVELTPGRAFSTFTAYLGFLDKSASNCKTSVQVIVDGSSVWTRTFSYGAFFPLNIDLNHGLKLRVEARFRAGGLCWLDFGAATFNP